MASRSIDDLNPHAKALAQRWQMACEAQGITVLIYCTYRSHTEQDELYQLGRTKPGKKVTNARAGESYHQYGVAWDAVPLINGKAAWSDAALYARMGEIAESMGIEWAGRWRRFKETAHFQVTQGLTIADFKTGRSLC